MHQEETLNICKKLHAHQLTPEKAYEMLLKLYNVKRTDEPECTACGSDTTKQSCIGKWEDGEEYRCDVCGHEYDFEHFK